MKNAHLSKQSDFKRDGQVPVVVPVTVPWGE